MIKVKTRIVLPIGEPVFASITMKEDVETSKILSTITDSKWLKLDDDTYIRSASIVAITILEKVNV